MLSIGAWHGMQLKDLFVVLFLLQGIQEFILGEFRLCTLHGTKISHLAKRKIIFKSALVGDTECEYSFVRTLPSQIHCWWLPTSSIMWFIGFSTFQSPSAFCMETQLLFFVKGIPNTWVHILLKQEAELCPAAWRKRVTFCQCQRNIVQVVQFSKGWTSTLYQSFNVLSLFRLFYLNKCNELKPSSKQTITFSSCKDFHWLIRFNDRVTSCSMTQWKTDFRDN